MKNLGDYAVVQSLGTGALGEVFLAQHRFLKRPYALKILPRELTDEQGFISTANEKSASSLSSNIPTSSKCIMSPKTRATIFL